MQKKDTKAANRENILHLAPMACRDICRSTRMPSTRLHGRQLKELTPGVRETNSIRLHYRQQKSRSLSISTSNCIITTRGRTQCDSRRMQY